MTGPDIFRRDAEAIDDLDDDAFRDLIEKRLDTSGGNSALWKLLCHPSLIERTWGCLDEMAEELDEEVARRGLKSNHFKSRRAAVVKTRRRQVEAMEARIAAAPRAEGGA